MIAWQHITKYDDWGWDTFDARFFSRERLDGLQALQRNLLGNGFRLLVRILIKHKA